MSDHYWRFGHFSYRVPVANGHYEVSLHFAETYNSTIGQRRFNVSVQDVPRLQEFDIAADAGINTALIKRHDSDVTNNEFLIPLSNGSVGSARIDAIRVVLPDDRIFASGFDSN